MYKGQFFVKQRKLWKQEVYTSIKYEELVEDLLSVIFPILFLWNLLHSGFVVSLSRGSRGMKGERLEGNPNWSILKALCGKAETSEFIQA